MRNFEKRILKFFFEENVQGRSACTKFEEIGRNDSIRLCEIG